MISRAELFAGSTATDNVSALMNPFREVAVYRAIAERDGRVSREADARLSDALIAATALEHRLSLVTRNRADFDKVRGLRLRSLR